MNVNLYFINIVVSNNFNDTLKIKTNLYTFLIIPDWITHVVVLKFDGFIYGAFIVSVFI